MSNDNEEKLIRQFLDGELEEEKEKEALHLMAEEQEFRELLHLEIYLNRVFAAEQAESDSFAVPEEFSDEVMQAVKQKEQQTADNESHRSVPEWVKQKVSGLLEPRPVQWRPAYGLAAVMSVLAVIIALNLGTQIYETPSQSSQQAAQTDVKQQNSQQQTVKVASVTTDESDRVWGRFFYVNEEAESVAVAGDFSNWEPIPLDKKQINGKTVWTNSIPMKRGEHRYMYIIDGDKWKTDPLASRYKEDGFGNRNAVITL